MTRSEWKDEFYQGTQDTAIALQVNRDLRFRKIYVRIEVDPGAAAQYAWQGMVRLLSPNAVLAEFPFCISVNGGSLERCITSLWWIAGDSDDRIHVDFPATAYSFAGGYEGKVKPFRCISECDRIEVVKVAYQSTQPLAAIRKYLGCLSTDESFP